LRTVSLELAPKRRKKLEENNSQFRPLSENRMSLYIVLSFLVLEFFVTFCVLLNVYEGLAATQAVSLSHFLM
jgi:uncharacterized membrane protein (DUF485 family)